MNDVPQGTAEIDALDELLLSEGWSLYRARIVEEIERRRRELEAQDTLESRSHFLRGLIAALRMVQDLPQAIRDEIKREAR